MITTEIIVVANRLPVTWTRSANGSRELAVSPGGLVSAVTPVAEQLRCSWAGWHNDASEVAQLVNGIRLVPVHAASEVYDLYYTGFANQVLWPVFHGLSEIAHLSDYEIYSREWWEAYQAVNLAFAQRVSEIAGSGALIWVHDYHLLLVPELLRELRPDLRIAVFLHIPFPALEHIETWSWASALLRGLSAAHLIGVQREQDAVNLREAQSLFAGEYAPEIRVFPISIDVPPFLAHARAAIERCSADLVRARYEIGGRQMLLSVDRLDYTKGVLERVEAFAEVLEGWRDHASRPVLVQVLTPTRQDVPAYEKYAARVRAAVQRVHEQFAASDYTPIITLAEPLSSGELVELYLAADVMCVTPLRDGMNLVAKEFVLSRIDEQGVLVLSREAGSADELVESLTVDPKDQRELVRVLQQALSLSPEEANIRMRALRKRVLSHDVHHWARQFLEAATEPMSDPAVEVRVTQPPFLR